MRLFKVCILSILFIPLLSASVFAESQPYNPRSFENVKYDKLNHALDLAAIPRGNIQYRDFVDEVEMSVDDSGRQILVILSTTKNPYSQVANLQKLMKKAKIMGRRIVMIDLSINHPYATFQNY